MLYIYTSLQKVSNKKLINLIKRKLLRPILCNFNKSAVAIELWPRSQGKNYRASGLEKLISILFIMTKYYLQWQKKYNNTVTYNNFII